MTASNNCIRPRTIRFRGLFRPAAKKRDGAKPFWPQPLLNYTDGPAVFFAFTFNRPGCHRRLIRSAKQTLLTTGPPQHAVGRFSLPKQRPLRGCSGINGPQPLSAQSDMCRRRMYEWYRGHTKQICFTPPPGKHRGGALDAPSKGCPLHRQPQTARRENAAGRLLCL